LFLFESGDVGVGVPLLLFESGDVGVGVPLLLFESSDVGVDVVDVFVARLAETEH
jgi:hypothetical protein